MAQTCFKSQNQDARMLKPWFGALIWKVNFWATLHQKWLVEWLESKRLLNFFSFNCWS